MRTRWGLAILLLFLALGVLPTSEAVDDPTAKRIAELISRLGSSRFEDRETATRELEALGQLAVPALEKASRSTDLDTQRRAQDMLARFNGRLDNTRLLAASRIRLTYKETPLLEAIADLSKKTGFTILYAEDAAKLTGRTVTVDTGETTFWQAFDQFCRSAGVVESLVLRAVGAPAALQVVAGQAQPVNVARPQLPPNTFAPAYGMYRQIILVDGKDGALPTDYKAAVRVRSLAPDLQPSNAPARAANEDRFILDVSPEPRIDLQRIVALRVDKAIDQQGQALKTIHTVAAFPARQVAAVNLTASSPALPRQILVRLEKGEKPARLLKEFEGLVTGLVRTAPKVLATVEKVLDAKGKTIKGERGVSLTLKEIKKHDDGRIEVQVVIERPSDLYGYTLPAATANAGAAPGGLPQIQVVPLQPPAQVPAQPRQIQLRPAQKPAQPNPAPNAVPPNAQPPNPAPQPKPAVPAQPAALPIQIQPIQVRILPAQGQAPAAGVNARNYGTTYLGLSLLDDKNEQFSITEVRSLASRNAQGLITQELNVTFNAGKNQGNPAKLLFTGTWNEAIEVSFKLKDVPLN